MINIPLNAEVSCVDGPAGKSTCVILNPETLQVTHFVVKEAGTSGTERLVSVKEVVDTTHDAVKLGITRAQLSKMEPFMVTEYRQIEIPRPIGEYHPVYTADIETFEKRVKRVPPGARSVCEGHRVEATDGAVGECGDRPAPVHHLNGPDVVSPHQVQVAAVVSGHRDTVRANPFGA